MVVAFLAGGPTCLPKQNEPLLKWETRVRQNRTLGMQSFAFASRLCSACFKKNAPELSRLVSLPGDTSQGCCEPQTNHVL